MTRIFTNSSAPSRRIAETHSQPGSKTSFLAKSAVKYLVLKDRSLPFNTCIFVFGARWRLPVGAILEFLGCATARFFRNTHLSLKSIYKQFSSHIPGQSSMDASLKMIIRLSTYFMNNVLMQTQQAILYCTKLYPTHDIFAVLTTIFRLNVQLEV